MMSKKNKQAEEIAALRKELAEVKAALPKPAPKPFVPAPHEPIDWTARMSMPPSALRAMVNAEPRGFMQGVVRDNRGPSTPTGMIPRAQTIGGGGPANVAGSGTGWAHETPIGPPPGLRYVDQQINAQDRRDRAELIEREARFAATEKMAEQIETMKKQTEALAKLAGQKK
jgi:hypothetical protein